MITDEQHREIGRILGYPSCCVEAWIADRTESSIRRGSIVERYRSDKEMKEINQQVSQVLGRPWASSTNRKLYVPCPACRRAYDERISRRT